MDTTRTNRTTLDTLRHMPVSEVIALPADHLAMVQADARDALDAAKRMMDWVEAAIRLRYEQRAIAARGATGKDTGTVRFEDGDVTIVADLAKKVEWDQARLAVVVERIRAAGDNPAEYVELTVGIEGFLGNLNEALETADAEGAAWRGFVQAWWDRFGTAEVGVVDLFDLAMRSDPAINLGEGSDRSQRTRFGMLLPKVRDRVFQIAYRRVRAELGPVSHKARQWRLQVMIGPDELDRTHGGGSEGNLSANRGTSVPKVPLETCSSHQQVGNLGNLGNLFHPVYVCGRARVY